ncbi:High affinity Ca2+/Mn2+ P-type ATPase-like protein [Dipsacomyces acuminosporus]|nr:High affinity Ca2+/Mn2+ P-type ATPase-like protein [Dipsacomyces acuminosporus]
MDIDTIERRDSISVDEFVQRFLVPNSPLVLGAQYTSSWPARKEWVGADGKPNFPRLLELYGDEQVQVAECDVVHFSDQRRTEMPFSEFIRHWRDSPERRLYCKDWHFTRSRKPYHAYTPIPHLSDDWINMYYDDNKELDDDYRFCYMGGDGTWTPFHEDVYRSYSWSANICGEKRWIFVPPGQAHLFTDGMGNWVYNLLDYDEKRFPRAKEVKRLEVIQRPGETVFVPSGWWHQVLNIGDTISINHNWSNEFNLHHLYARLRSDLDAVEYALRDVADMDGFDDHAQLVLKADSGTDYRSFFAFVLHVARIYIDQIHGSPDGSTQRAFLRFDEYFKSAESLCNALQRIRSVLRQLAEDPAAKSVSGLCAEVQELDERIVHSAHNTTATIQKEFEIPTMPVPMTDQIPYTAMMKAELPRGPLKTTNEYALDEAEAVLDALCSQPATGLSTKNALERQQVYGRNTLEHDEEEGILMKFVKSIVTNSMVMMLFGSAGISVLVGNWDDAFSITLAILIVSTVGFVQEYRSEKSLEALTSLVPNYCHAIRDGESTRILADFLVPGDIIKFSTGDRIPADVRIVKAHHLEIDESALTGESEALSKTSERVVLQGAPMLASTELSFADRKNIGFMGTLVRHGHGIGVVVRTGSDTEFGKIHAMMQDIEVPRTPLQKDMDTLGQQLSMISFVIIGLIFVIGLVQGKAWLEMFTIGVSLAVAAIPEGLPIVVTVTLALGVFKMAKRKAICRKLPSVETLGAVNVICADKTGTLTMNRMEVEYIYSPANGLTALNTDDLASIAQTRSYMQLLRIGNICNNAIADEKGAFIGQATDIAILNSVMKVRQFDERERVERLAEAPFSSETKFMQVAISGNYESALPQKPGSSQNVLYVKGALEIILEKCTTYFGNGGKPERLSEKVVDDITNHSNQLSQRGLRVVAAAFGTSADEMVFSGLFVMRDPPRENVGQTIQHLMNAGVRTVMITGDSEKTAVSVARNIGIPVVGDHRGCMVGSQLDKLTDYELAEHIKEISVFARATPKHKVRIVSALQKAGDVVAMTGDGVNDAPALKLADIGISMGENATDVSKEAADLILVNDDLSTILSAIEEGKSIFNNIRNFITFQLSTSVAALSLVALSTMLGLPQPLNAMQVLWINILMDGPPAQSLGVEPVDPDVMKQPPRSKSANIITRRVVTRVLVAAALIVTGTMAVYVSEMQDGAVTARDTSMTFTTFVCFDMFNALTCRSTRRSVFEFGLFSNTAFNFAVAGSLLGQLGVIYLPFLQRVFQTEALGLFDIAKILLLSSTVLWVDEAFKWWDARHHRSSSETIEEIPMMSV